MAQEKLANFLIYQPSGVLSLDRLGKIPGVELIDSQSVLGKKLFLHNETWLRDQIIWIGGVAYETLNNRGEQQYLISSELKRRGVDVVMNRYLPFQGGHILQSGGQTFCASSCAIDHTSHQQAFDRGVREDWKLGSFEQFKLGELTQFIRHDLPSAVVLPSLRELPWSYHADLSIAFLGDKVLLSDPSLYAVTTLDPEIESSLKEVERIIHSTGLETLRFPIYFDSKTEVFHSPLNGLLINGCFFYTLIEGMTDFNAFVKDFIQKNVHQETEAVLLPPAFLGAGGGLRCLSLEW